MTGCKYVGFRGESAHHIAVITKLKTASEAAAYKIVNLRMPAFSTTCQQDLRPQKKSQCDRPRGEEEPGASVSPRLAAAVPASTRHRAETGGSVTDTRKIRCYFKDL